MRGGLAVREKTDAGYTVERVFLAQITQEEAAFRAARRYAERMDAEEKMKEKKACPERK